MALLQISEPGHTPDPHKRRVAVGIDLGTTHSLVASVRSGVAECLPFRGHNQAIDPIYQFHRLTVRHQILTAQEFAAKRHSGGHWIAHYLPRRRR